MRRALHSPTATQRAFTLVELMAVIIIVSVFATLAAPAVGKRLKERRVSEAAELVSSLYVQARARAMGRGSAVLVRHVNGMFIVREAQVGNAGGADCAALPSSRCQGTNFNVLGANQYRELPGLDLRGRGEYGAGDDRVTFTVKSQSGTVVPALDICFTPTGRSFTRTNVVDPAIAFAPLTVAHEVEVKRGGGGLTRSVLILPNGAARQNTQ